MRKRCRMKKLGKLITAGLAVVLCIGMVSFRTYADAAAADEGEWVIEHDLDKSECRQGDTVVLSVFLKQGSGTADSQDMLKINGILEYDSSLFAIEKADILPVESEKAADWNFEPSTGAFSIAYHTDITVPMDGMILQLNLHVKGDASTGKTTVCVTHMGWSSSSDVQTAEIEHRVPSSITIAEAEVKAVPGDVNLDGMVNLIDVKYVMQHYNNARTLDSRQKQNADVNGDGRVNLTDAKLIMKYYNGEIDGF